SSAGTHVSIARAAYREPSRSPRLAFLATKVFSPPASVAHAPVGFQEADRQLARALEALSEADHYADWIVEMAQPYLGGEILEPGAGHGTVTSRLARYGKVTASDLSERAVDTLLDRFGGHNGVEVLHAGVDGAVAGRKFDTAVLVNVLEHI